MTFGSLMNWGGSAKTPNTSPIERFHGGSGGYWEHKSHGHGSGWSSHKSGGKGGVSSAALSALTLLAFLFLMNVMQQSLQENNSTIGGTGGIGGGTGTTAVLLREEQASASRNVPEKNDDREINDRNIHASLSSSLTLKKSKKGDTL